MAEYRIKKEVGRATLFYIQRRVWWFPFWISVGYEATLFRAVGNIEDRILDKNPKVTYYDEEGNEVWK